MSIQRKNTLDLFETNRPTIESNRTEIPAAMPDLINWLDESPNFIEVESTHTIRQRTYESLQPKRDSTERHDRVTEASPGGYRTTLTRQTTEMVWVNPEYEETGRACHQSQANVCSAWEDMQFPSHNWDVIDGVRGAHLYTWSSAGSNPYSRRRGMRRRGDTDTESTINYHAVQHPDGHGIIEHYDTVAAVRTRSGLVLTNEQDYGGGFARITHPDADFDLPLTGVKSVLDDAPDSMTLCDIESVHRDEMGIRYNTIEDPIGGHQTVTGVSPSRRRDVDVQMLDLRNGGAVVLILDSTANNWEERKCGFYLSPEERKEVQTAEDALEVLQPDAVKHSPLPVVPADEYAERGATFDGEQLGSCIIRQGEWYIIPQGDEFSPSNPIYKPLPVPNRDSDWEFPSTVTEHLSVDDTLGEFPEDCPECGATHWQIAPKKPLAVCTECDSSFVFGGQDPDDFVDEALYERYQEALDILDSHTPRDLAVSPRNEILVRGTLRHQDNEHQMINLRDRWHRAVENTRDVTVFNLDLNEGSGGVARWE